MKTTQIIATTFIITFFMYIWSPLPFSYFNKPPSLNWVGAHMHIILKVSICSYIQLHHELHFFSPIYFQLPTSKSKHAISYDMRNSIIRPDVSSSCKRERSIRQSPTMDCRQRRYLIVCSCKYRQEMRKCNQTHKHSI